MAKFYNIKKAFTLAEVLITLGIIGVVAVITIPSLIANMTGIKYRSQLKKSISTLNQAVKLNKAHYDWDFADVNTPCGGGNYEPNVSSDTEMSVCAIFNSNLSNRQIIDRNGALENLIGYKFNGSTIGILNGVGQYKVFFLPDGSMVGVRSIIFANCSLPVGKTLANGLVNGQLSHCTGFIDVNGFSLPNEETKCSVGTTSKNVNAACIVKNRDMKDIYPVVFHDTTVEGATNATRYVLMTSK